MNFLLGLALNYHPLDHHHPNSQGGLWVRAMGTWLKLLFKDKLLEVELLGQKVDLLRPLLITAKLLSKKSVLILPISNVEKCFHPKIRQNCILLSTALCFFF
jgi:hypothetical protein